MSIETLLERIAAGVEALVAMQSDIGAVNTNNAPVETADESGESESVKLEDLRHRFQELSKAGYREELKEYMGDRKLPSVDESEYETILADINAIAEKQEAA